MLTISGVSKSFSGRVLFADANVQVNREDRIGLVGPNGAGKSTFFSLVLKTDEPDEGTIHFQRGSTVGFLPQESAPVGDETVIELATAISDEFIAARKKMRESSEEWERDEAKQEYDSLGGYSFEAKAKQILAGLGFREKDYDRPARELSGGWVMRAHLGRLLVQEPDLLMLDEPTNHLDLETLLWFQDYLQYYPGAILMISHDREFLNQLVGSIIEIRQQKLIRYKGNYENYLEQRAAFEVQLLAAYNNQQKEIAHLMEFVVRFRAKASKAAQAQSKLKQVERMEKIEAPVAEAKTLGFTFPQPQRSGQKVISLENIHHAYGSNIVYAGMEFEAERGERTVLVGPNGSGKSTLLKILAGVLVPQQGVRTLGHNAKEGYFAQYRGDTLDMKRTVLEEAMDTPQRVTEQYIRTVLGSFLFRGDDVFKKVNVLSGGEKSRLALVKLLLNPPNLLLMDEPTTHLDMPSIDALVEALTQYQGTIIFISHDVYFIRALGNNVVHVNAGRLTRYAGNYEYYLEKTKATSARAALTAGQPTTPVPPKPPAEKKPAKSKEEKRIEIGERQVKSKELWMWQNKVKSLEKEIADLETKQEELAMEMEKPETYAKAGVALHLNRELSTTVDELAQKTTEWEVASAKLAAIEKK
ncbi:MAG: ABC transporter ATP-binding protein [Pedosphaera sp.]|nr:ABC transporter ATP-binding protein [Pedosphaera sp.]